MSDDYEFYGGTPPHEQVDTSEWAAEEVSERAARQRRQVWTYIYGRGEQGTTDDEGEIATGLIHQSFSARRRELILSGLVVETDQKRLTTSGRWARVRVCREFVPPAAEAQP